jgi:hypothetical protein
MSRTSFVAKVKEWFPTRRSNRLAQLPLNFIFHRGRWVNLLANNIEEADMPNQETETDDNMTNFTIQPVMSGASRVLMYNDKDDPREFLSKFDAASASGNVTVERRRSSIGAYLNGGSYSWFQHYDKKNPGSTWDEFKVSFIDHFHRPGDEYLVDLMLAQRVQRPDELVQNYFYDVLNLCHRVNADMSEPMKVKHIIKGLLPKFITAIGLVRPDNTDALWVLISAAQDQQILTARAQQGTVVSEANRSTQQSNQQINKLVEGLNHLRSSVVQLTANTNNAITQSTTPKQQVDKGNNWNRDRWFGSSGPIAQQPLNRASQWRQNKKPAWHQNYYDNGYRQQSNYYDNNYGPRSNQYNSTVQQTNLRQVQREPQVTPQQARPQGGNNQSRGNKGKMPPGGRTSDGKPICFLCSGVGHIQMHCPRAGNSAR